MKYKKINEKKNVFIEATNNNGLKMVISQNGAGLFAVYFNDEIMTVSPKNYSNYNNHEMLFGKTIGPLYGIIKDEKYILDNKEYDLSKNFNNSKLHNGEYSLNNYVFSQKMSFDKNFFSCIFSFKKKRMIDGLPGVVQYYITYAMSDMSNEIYIDFKAISDDLTPISITNNSCFCLGSDNIDTLYLTIPSDKYLDIDPINHEYKEFKNVDATYDFQKKKAIGKFINDTSIKGYENYFLFRKNGLPITLENSKYKLEIESDYDGAHINTDNNPDEIEMINSNKKYHRGVIIAPNINPLNLKCYRKNEFYHHQIIYRFLKK